MNSIPPLDQRTLVRYTGFTYRMLEFEITADSYVIHVCEKEWI